MNFELFAFQTFKKKETRGWGDDYKIYEVTVAELRLLAQQFATPSCQTELCLDRVKGIEDSYQKNPHFFEHKTTFVVAALVSAEQLLLMDGQHRLQFLKDYNEIPPLTTCRLVVYNIRTELELRDLFIDLNRDSFKSETYVSMGIDEQLRRDEFVALLGEKYGQWFAKGRKKATRIRTLVGFVDALPGSFLERFPTRQEALTYLIACNHRFLSKLGSNLELYVEERDVVQTGQIVFPLAYCNFIDFAMNPDTEQPYYEGRRKRKAITQKTRLLVWANEFGDAAEGKCPVCKTATLELAAPHGFECGHLTAHKNGGSEDASNLRPICAHCNQQMLTQNWTDYVAQQNAKAAKKSWFPWA